MFSNYVIEAMGLTQTTDGKFMLPHGAYESNILRELRVPSFHGDQYGRPLMEVLTEEIITEIRNRL